MQFTGNNSLYLPMVSRFAFTFSNVLVDSWTRYDLTVDCLSGTSPTGYNSTGYVNLFYLKSGDVFQSDGNLAINADKIVASYSTGVPFNVSGWLDMTSGTYLSVDGAESFQSSLKTRYNTSGSFGKFKIINSGSGSFIADIHFQGDDLNYSFSISPLPALGKTTGVLTSNFNSMVFNLDFLYYQSYQPLLRISGATTGVNSQVSNSYVMFDNDSDVRSNTPNALIKVGTLNGQAVIPFSFSKYIPSTPNFVITSQNSNTTFGGLFDGTWSGKSFVYQDIPSVTTLNYTVFNTDNYGTDTPKSFFLNFNAGSGLPYTYVSGLTLTSSGEYMKIPSVAFTGYYSITGIQQSFSSLLFGSGCSGNLPVTFTAINGSGTGASGYLMTAPILFQNLYVSGIQTYYQVTGYNVIGSGSGYNLPPIAVVNTGLYGNTCYDAPAKFSTTLSIFTKFNTFGATNSLADYLTGTVLSTTGLVSGGLATGYIVTGVNITNIGSGYLPSRFPYLSFVRQAGDPLTKNASGVFTLFTNPNMSNLNSFAILEQRIDNNDWTTVNTFSGSLVKMDGTQNMLSYRVTISGSPVTLPSSGGFISFSADGINYSTFRENVTFAHTFSTDPYSLKKNDINKTGVWFQPIPVGSDLTFLLTQSDLDTLYAAYSSNAALDLGDLDF